MNCAVKPGNDDRFNMAGHPFSSAGEEGVPCIIQRAAPRGGVHLTWRVATEAGRSALHLHWKEENGPPRTPPAESGSGTRLIQFSATQALGGSAELRFEPGGLQVRVTAPLH